MQRGRWSGVAAAMLVAVIVAGCASGDDDGGTASSAPTTASETTTSGAPADGDSTATGAADSAAAQAEASGEPIVKDGSMEIPGIDGGTAVFEVRNLRVTDPTTDTDCPGGSPVNAQRLAADLTAYLVPSQNEDPNVVTDDDPLPIPYVSQLPEIVLVGVGEQDTANGKWFVGISPVSRLLLSVPNTYLRPAPAGDATACAIEGWEPTDLAEPVGRTEMVALSSGFVPADFDPADYQFRIGRGTDNAYCWPLDDMGTPAELGKCR